MADYVNPVGDVEGTSGDNSFVYTVPLSFQSGPNVADALGGADTLLFDVAYQQGVTFSASNSNGVFNGQVQAGETTPRLTYYNFEQLTFVGTQHSDRFDLAVSSGLAGLTVDFDAGAGDDLLVYDFSAVSVGQSVAVVDGTISSVYGPLAGFERFVILGGSGSDVIQTGDGADTVVSSNEASPGSNSDTVSTGGGNDLIRALTPGQYDGGAGNDRWIGELGGAPGSPNTQAMTFYLDATITSENDITASNVEIVTITTGWGDDSFHVTRGGPVLLDGSAGHDTLEVALNSSQARAFVATGSVAGSFYGGTDELGFENIEDIALTGGTRDDSFRLDGTFARCRSASTVETETMTSRSTSAC